MELQLAGASVRCTRQQVATPAVKAVYKGIIVDAFSPNYKVIADTTNDEPSIASFAPEDLTISGIPQFPENREKCERPQVGVQVWGDSEVPEIIDVVAGSAGRGSTEHGRVPVPRVPNDWHRAQLVPPVLVLL